MHQQVVELIDLTHLRQRVITAYERVHPELADLEVPSDEEDEARGYEIVVVDSENEP